MYTLYRQKSITGCHFRLKQNSSVPALLWLTMLHTMSWTMIAPRKFVCLHSESIRSRNRSELTSAQSVRRGKTVLLCTTVRVLEARTLSLPRRRVPCSGKFGPDKKIGVHLIFFCIIAAHAAPEMIVSALASVQGGYLVSASVRWVRPCFHRRGPGPKRKWQIWPWHFEDHVSTDSTEWLEVFDLLLNRSIYQKPTHLDDLMIHHIFSLCLECKTSCVFHRFRWRLWATAALTVDFWALGATSWNKTWRATPHFSFQQWAILSLMQ